MDARYSLSEEKLLRSTLEVNELVVNLLDDDALHPQTLGWL